MEINKIYRMDAIEFMKKIDDKSIDMILCDLPYGTTACSWDEIILLEPMWKEMKRIAKDKCAMVFTASQPFTSKLIMSNVDYFNHEWIWYKSKASNFLDARKKPLKSHENILVFYKKQPTYNPQMTQGKPYDKGIERRSRVMVYHKMEGNNKLVNESGERFPKTVIYFRTAESEGKFNPTQKPVALFEYLIKTYTNEGDLVMDCVVGSGTTAVACLNTNRRFICNDISEEYVKIANERIKPLLEQETLQFPVVKEEK